MTTFVEKWEVLAAMAKMAEGQERLSPEFQKRLAELIEEKGCSKREFAQQVGVSKDVIIRGTMYGIVPSLQSLIKIADSLNLPLEYLLGKSDDAHFYKSETGVTFHTRIVELANEKGVKYSEIAHKMPFPNSYFYDWQREKTLPSLEYLRAIAEYFKVSIDYLLGRTDERD